MKRLLSLTLLLISFIICYACSNANENDLTNPIEEEDNNITYTEHIKPIMTANCIVCHANPPVNSAPMQLTDYSSVKQAVEERDLLDRIQRQTGQSGAMPSGGLRLPQAQIDLILEWQANGLLE